MSDDKPDRQTDQSEELQLDNVKLQVFGILKKSLYHSFFLVTWIFVFYIFEKLMIYS